MLFQVDSSPNDPDPPIKWRNYIPDFDTSSLSLILVDLVFRIRQIMKIYFLVILPSFDISLFLIKESYYQKRCW